MEQNKSIKTKAVFFDCWDTILSFCQKDKRWNSLPLYNHCTNRSEVDWDSVHAFADKFLYDYYRAYPIYEITGESYLNLIIINFGIKIDCPISQCIQEVLGYLDPKPIEDIKEFLSYLNEEKIYHAVISNTIYPAKDTKELIDRLLPDNGFDFFLASCDVGVKKPNPLFFETGLRLCGKKKEESIYIGNAFYQDTYGSYLAGFSHSIWLNHEKKERRKIDGVDSVPCIEISSYKELMDMFKRGIL